MSGTDPTTTEARRFPIRLPRPLWIVLTTVALLAVGIGVRFGVPLYWRGAAVWQCEQFDGFATTNRGGPEWLRHRVGDEWMAFFDDVVRIDFLDATDRSLPILWGVTELEAVQLRGSQITNSGMVNFVGLKKLKNLWLDQTNVGDNGLAYLKELTSLETLSLSDTQLTDAGLVHLQRLTNLQEISLVGTNVSDAGLVHLSGLMHLQTIRLRRTRVTQTGIAELKRVLPRLRVLADLD